MHVFKSLIAIDRWHFFLHEEHGVIVLGFFCSSASLISIPTLQFLMDFFLRNAIIGFFENTF